MAAPRTGPTAKLRPEDRLGHRTSAEQAKVTAIQVSPEAAPPVIPPANPQWAPVAMQAWDAFCGSPAAIYWESTDYATAYFLCEMINECGKTGYRAGQATVVRSLLVDLSFTESARRAVDLQINRTPEKKDPARVTAMDAAKSRRGG